MGDSLPMLHHVDVQPFLQRVCDGMAVGELLAGENFSLHDAMNAIEIGDVKMDVGLRRGHVSTAEELIAEGMAPVEGLAPESVLAVMDRLLAMEATWHSGVLLSQSVFTSLYLLDTDRVKSNPVLHAACLGVRSTCTLLHGALMSGGVVDDEDLLIHIFGFKLDLPGQPAVTAAQDALRKGIQAAEKGPAAHRLRFRLLLLQILQAVHPATKESLEKAARLCNDACAALQACAETALPEDAIAAAPGFSPEVHRRAMGLAPPRMNTMVPFPQAVEHWKCTVEGIGAACRWIASCRSWRDLRPRLMQFAAAPKNMPVVRSIVHRALVASLRAPAKQQQQQQQSASSAWVPSQQMIAAEFGWSVEAPPSPDTAMFVEQCAIAVQGWCHTMCLNRCRQRRRCRRLLEDWRNMIDHAFNAEASGGLQEWFKRQGWSWQPYDPEGNAMAGPVAAWVENQATWTMVMHLMLGFPLEVYAPHEYSALYFYCNYLLGEGQLALGEMDTMRPPPPPQPPHNKKHGGKSAKARKPSADVLAAEQARTAATVAIQVDRTMCEGLVHVTQAISVLGLIPAPLTPFNTERERFEQRFGCFAPAVRPVPLCYDEFLSFQQSLFPLGVPLNAKRVLMAAYDAFYKAQNGVAALEQSAAGKTLSPERAQHLKGVARVAVQNMMAVKLLVQSAGMDAGKTPPFCVGWDFKVALQHSTILYYPALVLKSSGGSSKNNSSK